MLSIQTYGQLEAELLQAHLNGLTRVHDIVQLNQSSTTSKHVNT